MVPLIIADNSPQLKLGELKIHSTGADSLMVIVEDRIQIEELLHKLRKQQQLMPEFSTCRIRMWKQLFLANFQERASRKPQPMKLLYQSMS